MIRLALIVLLLSCGNARADSSSPTLAAYYDRQMAIVGGIAYAWEDDDAPRMIQPDAMQVGVGRSHYYVLGADKVLRRYRRVSGAPDIVARGITRFAAGRSGVLAIRRDRSLWWHEDGRGTGAQIAVGAVDAAVGDGANYYVTASGDLFVKGRAHRGQYGDGRLTETADFVRTATGVSRVRAHTGHALHLGKNGDVMGTGGNIYGPVGRHGLGDKAERWSLILRGAAETATGASHSLAILPDGRLMAWGAGYRPDPAPIMTNVVAVAAGSSITVARKTDGSIWQWDRGENPRPVRLPVSMKGTP